MSSKFSLILILFILPISLHKDKEISGVDLNKAISCLHIVSLKFNYEHDNINQKIYSSKILSCFTLISEIDSKNVLLSIEQEKNYLSDDDIERLTDINNLKKLNKSKLILESKKLENAIKEFNKIGSEKKTDKENINKDDDYKKINSWKERKLAKFMIFMTTLLRLMNKFGRFIISIMCIYITIWLTKNCSNTKVVNCKNMKKKKY